MAVRFANTLKNAMLDAYETNIGASPKLKIYTGSVAGSVGTAPAGTLLATITAPADFMAAASGGAKALSGSWTVAAAATGTAGCYTFETSAGTILEDGTITATGGGGDLTLDSTSITSGQTVTVTSWTKSI